MNGTFYGVGLGPGDPELITLKALACLQRADMIYTVASRQSERSISLALIRALPGIGGQLASMRFTMSKERGERLAKIEEHADTVIAELRQGKHCVFATIGDPMTYSTCSYLLRAIRAKMPEVNVEIVPGVNSWSALAAARQEPLVEDREVLRIVPGYDAERTVLDFPSGSTTILLKSYHSREALLRGIPEELPVAYGADLTLPEQVVAEGREAIAALPDAYLSMLAVRNRETEER